VVETPVEGSDKTNADKTAAEEIGSERMDAEKIDTEKIDTEKIDTEKIGTEARASPPTSDAIESTDAYSGPRTESSIRDRRVGTPGPRRSVR